MRRLLLFGTAFALVVTACGAGASPAPRLSNVAAHTPPSLRAIATARKQVALRVAEKLLQRVVLPKGASSIREPSVLAHPDIGVSILHETAWRYAFWRVRIPLESVFAFEKEHLPRGFQYIGGGGEYRSLDFSNRSLGSRERLLTVDLARLGGKTVLRVEAGVPWIDPRPPHEVVPPAVREIEVRAGHMRRRVTKPGDIAHIVRWFNALNVTPRTTVFGCPFIRTATMRLSFRSAGGARLASALARTSPATGCSPIEFSIGGKRQTPLVDATFGRDTFFARVWRLLGLPMVVSR
jgi:hypothetical protein